MIRLIACVIGGALVAATHPDHCSALNIEFQRWWVRWERQDGSPSAVNTLMRMNGETNIAGILPIPVPTVVRHRTEGSDRWDRGWPFSSKTPSARQTSRARRSGPRSLAR